MGLNSSRHGGFTLIEVLVALAIFAVLAAALVLASGNFAERQRRIEERTLALWAAQNALDELRVGFPGAASGPDIDGQATVSLGGRDWVVTRRVLPTAQTGLHRVEVAVTVAGEERIVVELAGFVAQR
ncbi:MAG: Type II secretion system protein I [Pseudomonadales bacterium]|nr:Type II secretion system protein I [Pseudomonadales bacterium]